MKGPNKQALSNKVRLESLHQKKEIALKSNLLIKNSLNSLDQTKKSNQHIKFDDESSDEEEINEVSNTPNTIYDKSNLKTKSHGDVLGLNNASSDDDEIQIKPQFEGKSGKKLLEIQARSGIDARFKMDERFIESDSANEEEKNIAEENNEHLDEQKRNLAILQQVVGTAATAKSLKRRGKTFQDPDAKRYDPNKEDHVKLEVAPSSETVEKKKKKRKKKHDKPVPVDATKFFEASTTDLKSAFGKHLKKETNDSDKKDNATTINDDDDGGETQTFSFLKMMGRKPDEDDSSDDERFPYFNEELPQRNEKSKLESQFGRRVFKHDSSDSEMETEDYQVKLEKKETSRIPTSLFLTSRSDPRVLEGPTLFCSNKSMDEIREEWLEFKDMLKADYKKKHRNARTLLKRGRSNQQDGFGDQ